MQILESDKTHNHYKRCWIQKSGLSQPKLRACLRARTLHAGYGLLHAGYGLLTGLLGLRLLHTDYGLLFILSIIILINSEGPFKVIPIYVSISTVMIELFILKLAK